MAEKLLLNQLKRATLDQASQQALAQAAHSKGAKAAGKKGKAARTAAVDDAAADGEGNSDATLAERAARLARRIAKGKQPALDTDPLPTADADALLAAQLLLEEMDGAEAMDLVGAALGDGLLVQVRTCCASRRAVSHAL